MCGGTLLSNVYATSGTRPAGDGEKAKLLMIRRFSLYRVTPLVVALPLKELRLCKLSIGYCIRPWSPRIQGGYDQ